MPTPLLRVNLALLVAFAVIVGAATILGTPGPRDLYLHVGLFGTPLLAFGVVKLGSGILIASIPTRRVGAVIFGCTLAIASYALALAHSPAVAAGSLLLLIMPATVFLTTPRLQAALVVQRSS